MIRVVVALGALAVLFAPSAGAASWTNAPAMPTPRAWHGVAAGTGSVYAVGGYDQGGGGFLASAISYSPGAADWTVLPDLPVKRGYLAAAVAPSGTLFAFGGFNNAGAVVPVHAFSPTGGTWSAPTSLSTPRWGLAAVTAASGKIYVLGGYAPSLGTFTKKVDVYDPVANVWSTAADLPQPLYEPGAAPLPDGRILVAGGLRGTPASNSIVGTAYVYSPASNSWAPTSPMPTARYAVAATLGGDGRVYVIGGSTANTPFAVYTTAVESYDPGTGSWRTETALPSPRYGLAAASTGGSLFALGGFDWTNNYLADALVLQFDATPPAIVPVVTGTIGNDGWHTSDVAVAWTVSDPESGVANSFGCGPTLIVADTGGATLTCSATNGVGLTAQAAVTVRRDATKPVVVFTGNIGSYGLLATVSIDCAAADALSGVATSTCADVATTAWTFGPGQESLSASATDRAGNSGTGGTAFSVTATYADLCTLTGQFSSRNDHGDERGHDDEADDSSAKDLCHLLREAQKADVKNKAKEQTNKINEYIKKVRKSSTKKKAKENRFTAAQAATLIAFAKTLLPGQ